MTGATSSVPEMTSTKFATELKANGFCIAGNRIVADDCPGVVWKPVMRGGHIDRASTLRKIIRERREEMVRRARIGVA
jgi:hypothetical protein